MLSVHLDSRPCADEILLGKNAGHSSLGPRLLLLDYSGRNSTGRFFPLYSVFFFTHSEAFVHLEFLRPSFFLGFLEHDAP